MNSRVLLLAACAALACNSIQAHPDKVEDRLVLHFATGAHPPKDGKWEDLTHGFVADIKGQPALANIGPALALKLNGYEDHLRVPITAAKFPAREISIAAWVLINDATPEASIIGYMQDNGPFEKGWLLGYHNGSFVFGLASEGADDGDGKITRVQSKVPVEDGRWSHVAGTYDGSQMRLFVNGVEQGASREQSGDILYPSKATLAIGAYVDDNEFIPMEGALYEVKVYARALNETEISTAVEKNAALVKYESSLNKNLRFVVAPYLQAATRDSITIMCETSQPSTMTVEYGERQPLDQKASSSGTASINFVTLKNLKPHQPYFYRVHCDDGSGNLARSEFFTFQTAPGPKAAWAFGILGDTQRNPDVTRKCAEGIFALRPNFMLHLGDVVDDGFAKHQWVSELFEPGSALFAHVPMFPVIGNHEKNAHWYYDYFHLPEPEYYYSFIYGNAEFFMIDSNKDLAKGSEQYRWLEKKLKNSKATWKFASHHHPCFSSDENDYGDRWKGKLKDEEYVDGDTNAKHVVELYEKYGVDIAFAGHIHSYERTWPILQMSINQKKGVRYIVSGGGGGGLEQAAPQRAWFTLHVQRGHHYCFATVQDRTIQFKAYDIEGRLFDTFELTKDGND